MIPDDAALVLAAAQSMRKAARDRLVVTGLHLVREQLRGFRAVVEEWDVAAYALDLEAWHLSREAWSL